jgi:hypothetical protein
MHYECVARDFRVAHNFLSLETPIQIVNDLLSREPLKNSAMHRGSG